MYVFFSLKILKFALPVSDLLSTPFGLVQLKSHFRGDVQNGRKQLRYPRWRPPVKTSLHQTKIVKISRNELSSVTKYWQTARTDYIELV